MHRKRRLIKFLLVLAELALIGYTVYLLTAGYADRAPLFGIAAVVLAVPLVRAFLGRADVADRIRAERIYSAYLTDCFADAPRLRRALITILLDTLSDQPHPQVAPRLSAFLAKARTPRETAVISFLLGRTLSADGDLAAAEVAYRRALEEDPAFSSAWSNLGVLLETDGRYEEALSCLNRAVGAEPENAVGHANLANLYVLLHRPKDARAAAEKAIELNAGLAAAYVALSMAYALEGNKTEARRLCRKCGRMGVDEKNLERAQDAVLRGDLRVLRPRDTTLVLTEEGKNKQKRDALLHRINDGNAK